VMFARVVESHSVVMSEFVPGIHAKAGVAATMDPRDKPEGDKRVGVNRCAPIISLGVTPALVAGVHDRCSPMDEDRSLLEKSWRKLEGASHGR
jgi:hypothetical protein